MYINIGKQIDEADVSYDLFNMEKANGDIEIIPIAAGSTSTAWFVKSTGTHYKKIVKSLNLDFPNDIIKRARINEFLRQRDVIKDVYSRFLSENSELPMFSHPELYASSIGPIYLTEPTACNGTNATLEPYVLEGIGESDCRERIKKAFELALKIMEDLDTYHQVGYVHFDIKPENLLKITVNSAGDFVVRNLDFGSCVLCSDIIEHIQSIKKENAKNGRELSPAQIVELQKRYCKSSDVFYPPDKTQKQLERCFVTDDPGIMRRILFNLDIEAIFKIVISYYFGQPNISAVKCFEILRRDWFTDGNIRSFADYNIFYKISNFLFRTEWNNGDTCKDVLNTKNYIESILKTLSGDLSSMEGLEAHNLTEFDYVLAELNECELDKEYTYGSRKMQLKDLVLNAIIRPSDLIEKILFA